METLEHLVLKVREAQSASKVLMVIQAERVMMDRRVGKARKGQLVLLDYRETRYYLLRFSSNSKEHVQCVLKTFSLVQYA